MKQASAKRMVIGKWGIVIQEVDNLIFEKPAAGRFNTAMNRCGRLTQASLLSFW
jgi:hypothetical protein